MSAPPKPKLTGRLVAAEIEAIADGLRRLSLKDRDRATESQNKIAGRLERLAAALQSIRNL